MRRATVFAALVLAVLVGALCVYWALGSDSASSAGGLACSVKPSCLGDEVEVFRMSSAANAHAGTATGSSYIYRVCCDAVDGLSTNCSGTYDTVLALSGTDNAHAATTAGGSYTTEVCLSVGAGETVGCTYADTCDAGYACLATISGSANAHVADCDGTDDYTTKVCCAVTAGGAPVGGIADMPDVAATGDSLPRSQIIIAGVTAMIAFGAGGWYAKRRWSR